MNHGLDPHRKCGIAAAVDISNPTDYPALVADAMVAFGSRR
jgi:hypothetical protein